MPVYKLKEIKAREGLSRHVNKSGSPNQKGNDPSAMPALSSIRMQYLVEQ